MPNLNMTWNVLIILMGVNSLYLLLGGVVFHFLEKDVEDNTRKMVTSELKSFLDEHSCMTQSELSALITLILDAHKQGVVANENASSVTHWDLSSSIFFSGTVVTTIGYGALAPSTRGGREFCWVYAIFGIPVMMLMVAGVGLKLRLGVQNLIERLKISEKRPKINKILQCVLVFGVGVVLFFVVPALVFMNVEDWSFSTAFYYSVISLTTVGFGDYVAGDGAKNSGFGSLYNFFLVLWIVSGLSWLAGVIAVMQDFISSFLSKAEKTIQTKKDSLPTLSRRSYDVTTPDEKPKTDANPTEGENGLDLV